MNVQRYKLKNNEGFHTKIVTWEQVKPKVKAANPMLSAIIDELKPTKEHVLVLAKYPFGVNILNKERAFYPVEDGCLVSIDDPKMPSSLQALLSYNTTPLSLVLNNSVEIFVETPEPRTIPFKIFTQGVSFGVWEIMDFPKVTTRQNWTWNASSGARTVFLLPSISESVSHTKLQIKYKIKSHIPDTIFNHHKIFKDIIHASDITWGTEILFFTKKWIEPDESNTGWLKLKNYWMATAWHQMHYWTNRVSLNLNWENFIAELNTRHIRLYPYLLDTMKQLISIATGTITGFRPIDENDIDEVMPLSIIEKAYLKDYKLKKYVPVIMRPDFLYPAGATKHIYYSLQYPTLPEKPEDIKTFPSTLKMMRQLKLYVDIFMEMLSQFPPVTQPQMFDLTNHIKIDFFHSDTDKHGVIRPVKYLIKEDPIFDKLNKKSNGRKVPENCHFFKGCVRISFIN